jgi:hypothetical protein
MPVFEFTSPEGKTYEVSGPEGATKEQAFDILKSSKPELFKADKPAAPQGENIFGMPAVASAPTSEEMQERRAYAARGALKGFLGMPGALEEFGAYTIPRALGFEAKDTPTYAGGATLFPTPKMVGKILGIKEAPEKSKQAETLGEVIGGVVGPGVLSKIGRGAKITAEAVAALPARKTIQALEKPTSVSAVGEKIEKQVTSKLDELSGARSKEAEKLFDDYIKAGTEFEQPILNQYLNKIYQYYAENATRMSPDEIALLRRAAARVSARPAELGAKEAEMVKPGMAAIEKERRFLKDVANGLEVEGAEAIPARLAHDLSTMLEETIQSFVPKEYRAAIDAYAKASEPINKYATALGQKIVKRADEFLPDVPKVDPANLPTAVFKTRNSFNAFRELAGDDAFVNATARQHIANELRGATKAAEVRGVLSKNYDWLQELPELRSEIEDLARRLTNAERLKTGAKWAGAAAIGGAAIEKGGAILGGE